MKIQNEKMRVSLLALAVQGALLAMCSMPVHAEDDEVTALTMPTNYVEIGALNTSRSSAKFGEYNGLNKSGAKAVGNLSVRGGDAYGESNGTKRWSVSGSDLGTTSRTLGATMSEQGRWNAGIAYDELRRNITDSYQTPYVGDMGGNNFTLPAGFGVVASTGNGTRALNPVQQEALHAVDVGTTRKNTTLTAGFNLTPEWNVAFDFNHLDQSGAKLMGFGQAAVLSGSPAVGVKGEAVAILPNPTNYKTDTVNLALNWAGEKGYMTTSFFGSFFRDGYDRVNFQTYSVAGASTNSVMQIMSTAPGNNFRQLNVNGGYVLGAKTKLTGGLSYGRNTQNDPFVQDAYSYTYTTALPAPTQTSLGGLVVNTHADLKLIDQTTGDLALSAGVKYDKRDNRTTSNIYNFHSLSGANDAKYPNTPLSNKKTQWELAGDYRLGKGQNIRLAYNREDVKRWCNSYGVDAVLYPAGTNCVVATANRDNKLSATYRRKSSDDVNLNVGYSYSNRTNESDINARAAVISTKGGVAGQNGGDYLGFYPYFDAPRKEQMLKAGVNWQASQKLSVGLIGRFTDDKYGSTYGVQKGNSWSMNLDAAYSYSENGTITGYLTQQHMQRDMTNQQALTTANASRVSAPAGATWTNTLKSNDTTVGLGVKHGGLMGSKLELTGDLTYSLGKTGYGTQLNYVTTTTGGLTCSDPTVLLCGDLPDTKNQMIQLKVIGNYKLEKSSRIALGYIYQNLKSTDYYYNGYQIGYTPITVMPTNQQSGSYAVNVVTASYIYEF